MPVIKGKKYKRTSKLKSGKCAKGSVKKRRGKVTGCYEPLKGGAKKRKK